MLGCKSGNNWKLKCLKRISSEGTFPVNLFDKVAKNVALYLLFCVHPHCPQTEIKSFYTKAVVMR